jgi:hypothetical protein
MPYIYQSPHPDIIYDMLLEKMSKVETTYYVVEVTPITWATSIWYELYSDTKPEPKDNCFIEMIVHPIEMFSPKHYVESKVVRSINKIMRRIDDSKAWPVCGSFNATERAIRRIARMDIPCDCGYSYWKTLEQIISEIVNGEL